MLYDLLITYLRTQSAIWKVPGAEYFTLFVNKPPVNNAHWQFIAKLCPKRWNSKYHLPGNPYMALHTALLWLWGCQLFRKDSTSFSVFMFVELQLSSFFVNLHVRPVSHHGLTHVQRVAHNHRKKRWRISPATVDGRRVWLIPTSNMVELSGQHTSTCQQLAPVPSPLFRNQLVYKSPTAGRTRGSRCYTSVCLAHSNHEVRVEGSAQRSWSTERCLAYECGNSQPRMFICIWKAKAVAGRGHLSLQPTIGCHLSQTHKHLTVCPATGMLRNNYRLS